MSSGDLEGFDGLFRIAFQICVEQLKRERGEDHSIYVANRFDKTRNSLDYMPKNPQRK